MKLAWSVALAATIVLVGGAASAGRPRQAPLFPLQFGATGTVLFVAGYTVDAVAGVTGECDYKVSHSGSGRGGGYRVVTDYYQGVCTWDLFGNLVSETFTRTTGAPTPNPPTPLYTIGNQITYGIDASGDSTGQTTATTGFVIHNTADYVWTPVSQITTDARTPISFQATLTSTGNLNLDITGSTVYTSTGAAVTVLGDTCTGQAILPGQSCTITLSYDPTGLVSDTGTVFDTVTVELTTNSGKAQVPFTQSIFVTGVND
jgi:hypothetical protein